MPFPSAGTTEGEIDGLLDRAGAEFTLGVVERVLVYVHEMLRHAIRRRIYGERSGPYAWRSMSEVSVTHSRIRDSHTEYGGAETRGQQMRRLGQRSGQARNLQDVVDGCDPPGQK